MYPAALAHRRLRALAGAALPGASPLTAATLVVTSNADTAGSTCGAVCTLRQAITAANATAAADTINVAITLPPRGETLIRPATQLPSNCLSTPRPDALHANGFE